MTTPAAVTCRGLTKVFGSGPAAVVAVDHLDLDVPAGSVFGLLGPNGAGKTTAIRLITGLARATSGSASIDGVTVRADDPAVRRSIGVLDQAPRFYGWMRGREVVTYAGELSGLAGLGLRRRVADSLDLVGLSDAAGRRVAAYSGGMRQRLGIAAALVAEPRLLILDEPVNSLDPEGRRDLLALIAGLRGTTTVVLSTHVLDDVERVCDRVAILAAGRLVTEAPLEELLREHATPVYWLVPAAGQEAGLAALRTALAGAPWVAGVDEAASGWTVAVRDDAASAGLLPLVVAAGVRLDAFERARPTLEDVFLRLVGRRDTQDRAA